MESENVHNGVNVAPHSVYSSVKTISDALVHITSTFC